MNTKSMFVKFADGSAELRELRATIIAAKPWTLGAAGKHEIDAAMVRALAHRYRFKYGPAASNAVLSGLAIKSPGKDAPNFSKYGAARKAISDARKLFNKPVTHKEASLKDKEHAEAKRLAKFTKAQRLNILKLAARYEEKQ